jgi:23S rRNA (pseudouridine1915-N3)-methyltransferase
MKIKLIVIGKTTDSNVGSILNVYTKRIKNYCDFSLEIIPDIKNPPKNKRLLIEKEGDLLVAKIVAKEYNVLLDVNGVEYSSVDFSKKISNWMVTGKSRVTFIIGGAFGVSEDVIKNSDLVLSMSKMTFSHQFIRMIFLEQLYRAFTIIKNESYHH